VADSFLLLFLRAGLINVGGDDTKFDKLKETAADIAAELRSTPRNTTRYGLAAFDSETTADDPAIVEVMNMLANRWPTYVNTFSGTPVVVIRALLLDALAQEASNDDRIAVALSALVRNVVPHVDTGNETAIWNLMLAQIEQRADARAEKEWAAPARIMVSELDLPKADVEVSMSRKKVSQEVLQQKIQAAAGPHGRNNQPIPGANPHWPNSAQAWSFDFAPRISAAIAEAIDEVAAGIALKPVDLATPLTSLARAVSSHVREALDGVSGATAGLQRRTNLLWWRESLYSPSARRSYRGSSGAVRAALMAFDLHNQVPTYSPASVSAFLFEAVNSLARQDSAQARPIGESARELVASQDLAGLRAYATELNGPSAGRAPIVALAARGSATIDLMDDRFRGNVGVPPDTPLTPPEFAVWIFRELQALRAVAEIASGPAEST
jgi:GTPase-associated system helical domain